MLRRVTLAAARAQLRITRQNVADLRPILTMPLVALIALGVLLQSGKPELAPYALVAAVLMTVGQMGNFVASEILSTVLLPSAGWARVLGHDVATETRAVRPLIGIVFGGDKGLYMRLTARQNLEYWAALYQAPPRQTRARVEQLLERTGLTDRADHLVQTYSRGMKQRLHLARGLVGNARVLYLDEPTLGMDPMAARDFRQIVKELREEGRTILLTTHDMGEAEALCDQVALVDHGKVLAVETPARLSQYVAKFERIDFDGGDPELIERLHGQEGVAGVKKTGQGLGHRVELSNERAAAERARPAHFARCHLDSHLSAQPRRGLRPSHRRSRPHGVRRRRAFMHIHPRLSSPVLSSRRNRVSPCCWAIILSALLACKPEGKPEDTVGRETLSLRYEGSPGNVTIAELAEDLGFLAPVKLEYVGNNMTGGPHSIQAVLTGDLDVGGAFNGAIVKLVASQAKLRSIMAAYGSNEQSFQGFYSLEDSPIRGARDFIDKKVAINTLGAHAEFALREYLAREGLTADEVSKVTLVALPSANGEQALRNRQVDVACLATIFRDKALARGGLHLVFSDYQLFGRFNAGSTVMSEDFIKLNPGTARKYVEGVGQAIEWAKARPRAEVVARMESIIEKRGRNEDTAIVRYWTSTTIATPRGWLEDVDFQRWIDWLVKDGQIGKGQIEPSEIYTNQFQPEPARAPLPPPASAAAPLARDD
jgi:ABC-type multidrug transport system ATPase subunit/ABC-type nitrate/sulfonate/bicarbonate transport system substrate-binding protein